MPIFAALASALAWPATSESVRNSWNTDGPAEDGSASLATPRNRRHLSIVDRGKGRPSYTLAVLPLSDGPTVPFYGFIMALDDKRGACPAASCEVCLAADTFGSYFKAACLARLLAPSDISCCSCTSLGLLSPSFCFCGALARCSFISKSIS